MTQAKPWYQSRTLWANVLLILAGALTLVSQHYDLSPDLASGLLVVSGIINLILRALTGQPITGTPAARRRHD